MRAWRDLHADFGQMLIHRLGVNARHDDRRTAAARGQIAPNM
jgi:hypothetical protein